VQEEFKKIEVGYGYAYGQGRDVYVDAAYFTATGFQAGDRWGYESSRVNQSWAAALGTDPKGMIRTARPFRFPYDNYRLATYWNHDNLKTHVIFGQTQQDMFSFNEQGYLNSQYLLWQTKYLWELNPNHSLECILSGEVFDEYYFWTADALNAFGTGLRQKKGGDEIGAEGKLIYRTEVIPKNRIAVGAVVGDRDMNSMQQFFRASDLVGPGNDASGKYLSAGLFGEDIISLTDKLTAYLGLRYDMIFQGRHQSFNETGGVKPPPFTPDNLDHLSPRVGLVYELGKNDTVKLSYQQGFRFPEVAMYGWHSAFDNILDGGGFARLPKINTETMDSIELNYVKKFPEQHLTAYLNVFHNIYHDRLTWIWFKPGDGYMQPAAWSYVTNRVAMKPLISITAVPAVDLGF
jgi:outer membrane receptor protein involved in Fe transport